MVIFEIGVGPIETCRSRPYWDKAECVLFEPAVPYYKGIEQAVKQWPNVQVHNIAIYDYNGQCNFIESNQISSIKEINSPRVQFGVQGGKHVSCKCAKLSEYDKGNINKLLLDMEGAEWFALKHLISRPQEIVVETQLDTAYKNPYLKEINQWMSENGYKKTNHVGADSIWHLQSHKMFL